MKNQTNQPTKSYTVNGITLEIRVEGRDGQWVETKETARLAKAYIKAVYGLKSSVKSNNYSGGSSVNVIVTEPVKLSLVHQIDKELKAFKGATFDGMTDMKNHHSTVLDNGSEIDFDCDFIHCNVDSKNRIDDFCYNDSGGRVGLRIEWAGCTNLFENDGRTPIAWTEKEIRIRKANERLEKGINNDSTISNVLVN